MCISVLSDLDQAVLKAIRDFLPDNPSLGQIARRLPQVHRGLKIADVNAVLVQLLNAGFVRRTSDSRRGTINYCLTEAGEAALDAK